MEQPRPLQSIVWHRSPIERQLLARLTRKSDLRGLAQTCGFLGVVALTGGTAYYSGEHWPWYATLVLLLVHGTCWAFVSNALHEFSHGTVFSTYWLNKAFLGLFSYMSWINPVLFWASHTEHHKFTLHAARDLEIDVDASPTLRGFLLDALVSPRGLYRTVGMNIRHAFGWLEGEWERHLFPPSEPELKRRLVRGARILLVAHVVVIAIALYFRLWMLIVIVSFARFYGGGIQWLCNEAQHCALPGNVADFRLCSRTIHLNAFLRFVYWHMNYHIEHHQYAAVPCYRLARLHEALREDMPVPASGLVATWRQINTILQRKKSEPGYQYRVPVPERQVPGRMRAAPAAAAPGS